MIALALIAQMGWLAIGFSLGIAALSAVWYLVYGKSRVARRGAIFHVCHRLGQFMHHELEQELRDILAHRDANVADEGDDDEPTSTTDPLPGALPAKSVS